MHESRRDTGMSGKAETESFVRVHDLKRKRGLLVETLRRVTCDFADNAG